MFAVILFLRSAWKSAYFSSRKAFKRFAVLVISATLLTGVAFVSDGALPFVDNVEEAARHGVSFIAEPGGSIRSDLVRDACERLGIKLVQTGVRLFRH